MPSQSASVIRQNLISLHDPIEAPMRTCLGLFGVVESAGPIDCDLCGLLVQFHSAGHRAARGQLTELVQAIEHRTVLAHVNCRGGGERDGIGQTRVVGRVTQDKGGVGELRCES